VLELPRGARHVRPAEHERTPLPGARNRERLRRKRVGEHAREGGGAAHDHLGPRALRESLPGRDRAQVLHAFRVRRARRGPLRARGAQNRIRHRLRAAAAKARERQLGARRGRKLTARALLCPFEQASGAIGEAAVARVLRLMQRPPLFAVHEPVHAVARHPPGGWKRRDDQEDGRAAGERGLAHGVVLLAHVAA
jgi:hypothetical protein